MRPKKDWRIHQFPIDLEDGTTLVWVKRKGEWLASIITDLIENHDGAICLTAAGYPYARIGGPVTLLHNLLYDIPEGMMVDHHRGHTQECTYEETRLIPTRDNARNQLGRGRSKYIGVSWHKKTKKWQVQVSIEQRNRFIGHFDNEEDAAQAADEAKRKHGLVYSTFNFPLPGERSAITGEIHP